MSGNSISRQTDTSFIQKACTAELLNLLGVPQFQTYHISKDKKVPLLGCPVAGFVMKLAIKVFCNHVCPCQRFESCDRVEREHSEFLGELMNPLED